MIFHLQLLLNPYFSLSEVFDLSVSAFLVCKKGTQIHTLSIFQSTLNDLSLISSI